MSLTKIIAVCAANAFRSPSIEAVTRGKLSALGSTVPVLGRGVKADYWSDIVSGREEIQGQYKDAALARALAHPGNYSENIRNMLDQGADPSLVARYVLGEERLAYKLIIQRFCEELNLSLPSGFHQQLKDADLEGSHLIIASDSERKLIPDTVPESRISVLGIEDVLGGTYQDKKPVLREITSKVDRLIPEILAQYQGETQ
ncbi:hypothetical protein J4410_01145 [Candidatus Woesearchaeota archaeon]|nr:hypothetical protein [Candidatus Woesearchaeota archaeon]